MRAQEPAGASSPDATYAHARHRRGGVARAALCEQRGSRSEARAFAQRAADVLDGAVTDDHPHRIAAQQRLAELAAGEADD